MTDLSAKCADCGETLDHGSVDGAGDAHEAAKRAIAKQVEHRCKTGPRAAIRSPQLAAHTLPGRSRFR